MACLRSGLGGHCCEVRTWSAALFGLCTCRDTARQRWRLLDTQALKTIAKPIIEGFLASPSKALLMPIYAYKCDACGHAKDVLQKMSDAPLTDCPACGAPKFSKQLTAPGFQLKGTGWYATDFKGGGAAAVPAAAGSAADAATPAPAAAADTAAPAATASAAGCAASCACH